MFGLGGAEILVIVAVALLVFGPNALPQVARTVKAAYREFQKLNQQVTQTVSELNQEIDRNLDLGLDEPASGASEAGADPPSATSAARPDPAPLLRAPDGERAGRTMPEAEVEAEPPAPRLPVATADDYLAPAAAIATTGTTDDYLAGGGA
jgi:sec-independent protein translocase protein TatB